MKPLGYTWLLEQFRPRSASPYHRSYADTGTPHREVRADYEVQVFPRSYVRDDSPIAHLVFALKYDGLELSILHEVLPQLDAELTRELRARPTGKHLRQLWFLREWLSAGRLDLPDASRLGSELLADPERYITLPGERSPRHAIVNNLLGTAVLCPMIRRSERLEAAIAKPLAERAQKIVSDCEPGLLLRAVRYLYTKETKSSFAIERVEVRGSREERFVALLSRLGESSELSQDMLVRAQHTIVDREFREDHYRRDQNFIGQTIRGAELVHYIPPRPEDVLAMMKGLEELARRLSRPGAGVPAPIAAAAVAFAFVYIHPFLDGNGRLHRFLIHWMLARLGFAPKNLVFPVSAAILADFPRYDEVLTAVDRQIMPHVVHDFDGPELLARGNDAHLYAYLDLTPHAEALYGWIEGTIDRELVQEIDFLRRYDQAKRRMRLVVDLPDRLEDLFVTLCHAPPHKLSQTKRSRHFAALSDVQIEGLEAAVAAAFGGPRPA